MTRAEIIAKLKKAKRKMSVWESSMIADASKAFFKLPDSYCFLEAALYQNSLDAAISLVEREKPGWRWEIASESGDFAACAFISGDDDSEMSSAYGATPAIALLIALLSADATP